eukprot:TRINITY_DN3765_c0_g2_i1.p1 TRINITY_DN3765_c0_g2~~TRINITY_DN3765_c0_g2_i1.p1  ORF type:complete len:331 (-),score=-1.16 TRINITY_DN3765_c0_g2_i1:31-1023(-)
MYRQETSVDLRHADNSVDSAGPIPCNIARLRLNAESSSQSLIPTRANGFSIDGGNVQFDIHDILVIAGETPPSSSTTTADAVTTQNPPSSTVDPVTTSSTSQMTSVVISEESTTTSAQSTESIVTSVSESESENESESEIESESEVESEVESFVEWESDTEVTTGSTGLPTWVIPVAVVGGLLLCLLIVAMIVIGVLLSRRDEEPVAMEGGTALNSIQKMQSAQFDIEVDDDDDGNYGVIAPVKPSGEGEFRASYGPGSVKSNDTGDYGAIAPALTEYSAPPAPATVNDEYATPGPPAQMYGSGPAERPEGNYDEPPQGMAPANEYDVVP